MSGTSRLLATTQTANFSPLGSPKHREFIELADAVNNPKLLLYFAEPVMSVNGEKIDWYTSVDGPITPFNLLQEQQKLSIRQQLVELESEIQRLIKINRDDNRKTVLENAICVPSLDNLLLVGNQIILTLWSYKIKSKRKTNTTLAGLIGELDKENQAPEEHVRVNPPTLGSTEHVPVDQTTDEETATPDQQWHNDQPSAEDALDENSSVRSNKTLETGPNGLDAGAKHNDWLWANPWFWIACFFILLVVNIILIKDACGIKGIWFLDFCSL